MRKRSLLEGFKLYYEKLESEVKLKRRARPSSKLAKLRKPNRDKKPHHKTNRRRRKLP